MRAAGLKIPTDVSVLAFDDMSLYPLVEPPITAITQPAYEMDKAAADLLPRQIDGRPIFPTSSCPPPSSCATRSPRLASDLPARQGPPH
ncbi:substrate-binding domain-containing protein [Kibdelosporangium banguiense]|uniref:substrate-binding domain-containing protein n=1 Tax=Kibdelosporangium banguiense TaxID=1365924 RepID=UPI001AE6FC80